MVSDKKKLIKNPENNLQSSQPQHFLCHNGLSQPNIYLDFHICKFSVKSISTSATLQCVAKGQ